jgi:hypothetical protein
MQDRPSQHVVAKRGDILPGQTYAISDFGWNRNQLSIDSSGHLMYVVTTYNVSSLNSNIYLDHTKIAQGGDISPFGSSYLSFSSVALDDQDNYLFRCHLNDPFGEYGIVSNAAAIVQVGDSFPSIEPFQINYLGTPLFLGNDGRVIWTGTWDSAAGPQGTGIFADYALLVSVGGTVIHGVPVQELTLVDGSLTLSQSGQYLVFLARLADNTVGAYRINLWQ